MVLNKKNINMVAVAALLIFGIAIFVYKEEHGVINIVNLFIPIVGLVFIVLDKRMYIFYAIVCFLITAFGGESNFSGAVFFFMSVYDDKSKKSIWINSILMVIGLVINVFNSGYLTLYPLAMVVAFSFVFLHMYVRFWPISEVRQYIGLGRGLTVEQLEAIDKMKEGKSHKDAAKELGISRSAYSTRLSGLRGKYHTENDSKLTIALIKDGIISLNSLTDVNISPKTLNKPDNS